MSKIILIMVILLIIYVVLSCADSIKSKIIILMVILVIICVVLSIGAISACNAIEDYNEAVKAYNEIVDGYNEKANNSGVENIVGVPSQIGAIHIEDDSFWEGLCVVVGENTIEKIEKDTETIYQLIQQAKISLLIIEQIKNPAEDWVESRLRTVSGVTGTQAVTKGNNPDGLLGKVGGYNACIYFTYHGIDSSSVSGADIVSKGTDAGGAIEVYSTVEEAEKRCEYLAGFDGTILYSGSYALVGTMVIRTSYKLSNEEQVGLTGVITQALTAVQPQP